MVKTDLSLRENSLCTMWFAGTFLLLSSSIRGQSEPVPLAKVGNRLITTADINFHLRRQPNSPRLEHASEQAAVKLIVQQFQALQTLRRLRLAASATEVDNWIERQAKLDPSQSELDLEAFPDAEEWLREQVAFRLSWQRYLAKHLTERNLARHFQNQLIRFDGTRFQVQILSAPTTAGESDERQERLSEFANLLAQLKEGKIEWSGLATLAEQKGWSIGEKGWAKGTGTLEPDAISAILELEGAGIAGPFFTSGGIHLAKLYAVEAGDLSLEDVQDEVRGHMLIFMLNHLARQAEEAMPFVSL